MKKLLLGISLLIMFGIASEGFSASGQWGINYFPIQFSVWPGVKNWPAVRHVTGIRLGVPYASSEIGNDLYGLDLAIVSQSSGIYGLQLAAVTKSENVNGLQLAWANIFGKKNNGVQLAFFNMNENSVSCQFGVGNINNQNDVGGQLGVFNLQGANSKGAQVGFLNRAESFIGCQLGVINIVGEKENTNAFQLGIINYLENGFLPLFPLFNFSI